MLSYWTDFVGKSLPAQLGKGLGKSQLESSASPRWGTEQIATYEVRTKMLKA